MVTPYRDPFAQLQRELERMLETTFGSVGASTVGVYPTVNVFDAGEEFVVKAELPGVDPQKVDIEVQDNTVVLRGERRFDDLAGRNVAYHRREREQGQFRRVVRLPGKVDGDKAVASYHDGVLSIRVPKAKETQPRRVAIQAA
jgi:HSP20 family protein